MMYGWDTECIDCCCCFLQIKLRTQIATEQEKLLNEKEQELEKIRQELATTKNDFNQNKEQVDFLK